MTKVVAVTGNEAVANAFRQIEPDVCAAYPITPQTELMQRFAAFVSDGKVKTELILVESEHSAMSACVGAAAAGGRVATATSSQGLALMWEILFIASGLRLPIVMPVVNRALSAPINIHCDHSDAMGARDSGWIQLWSENAQEAYDNTIQAFRIAEDMDIRLPVMVCYDGFIISHSIERIEYLDDETVKKFVGEYKPLYPLLDIDNPKSYGPLILTDLYHEVRKAHSEVYKNVPKVVLKVAKEFEKISGRKYGLFETYRLDDAEIGIVILNSAAGTTKDVIDEYRDRGIKVGLLKPRLFRPFPYEEVGKALKHLKAVCVLDRADAFGGSFGPLYLDIAASLCNYSEKPLLINRIYGLGGRDYMPEHASEVIEELKKIAKTGKIKILKEYIGVRE
ncbi:MULTISPECIES: pyruvate ferredoxin oxidoreductase [Thermodesulfovibrio]|uniref:2-ketoisovalerate ferredoxin oxidoreductase subunit alpha n=1 Tax=Thermodesulfovibrio yellowstonii TaxID=28262 RepID=A0A9W6GGL9_9BACT|nr:MULTISPECIES: pyruvate ferredoxin oxidoreductase [Thermodesulfovibrio]MDI6865629.1 pyruvate ferredoxin oxidoreductase [Thermodesulfovibrio yellowstonii]GLI53451.1 2-ketoisovalerate ferredoxin oxidoreductase subunit alpha [Thermodesulfovibrio islandicus]